MTQSVDHLTRTTPPSDSRADPHDDRAVQTNSPHPATARELNDRQAVIAAMITNGVTCQDIAVELMLPLPTVQAHLHQALQTLNLSRVEDLTYEVIAAHYERALSAAQSDQRRTSKCIEPTEPAGGDNPSTPLVALDETKITPAHDEDLPRVVALTRELVATRAQLEQERDTVRHLHQALSSRDTIGQAKGILMERHKINADVAFATLVSRSNLHHRKLVDVAHDLIYSGEEGACREVARDDSLRPLEEAGTRAHTG